MFLFVHLDSHVKVFSLHDMPKESVLSTAVAQTSEVHTLITKRDVHVQHRECIGPQETEGVVVVHETKQQT